MNEFEFPWFVEHPDPGSIYKNGDFIVLDYETDNEDMGSALNPNNDIFCGCWLVVRRSAGLITTVEKKEIIGGIYEFSDLLDDIASVQFVVAQNAKMEAQWLKRSGAELRDILFYDTMLGAWVLDGNQKRLRNLNALARRYSLKGKTDFVSDLVGMGVSVRDLNPDWVVGYCHDDVQLTLDVFLNQVKQIDERQVWHLVHVRNLTCAVLSDIEFEGLTLDAPLVQKIYNEAVQTVEQLGAELAEMTGGINLSSPKQLAAFIYDKLGFDELMNRGKPVRTEAGGRMTGTAVLAKLKATTPEQQKFIDLYKTYNKQTSLLEKNLEYFQLTCEQRNNKFFGNLRQAVVQTGRLASSGIPIKFEGKKKAKSVQLQNLPRELKKVVWSGDDDWLIGEYDSAQVEFRVAVDMAQDPVGIEEVINGVDVHSFTAKVLTEAGEPTTRQKAKASTFRPLFGGSSGSPAIKAYCEFFKDKYKSIAKMQSDWAYTCLDKGQYVTPYGMTFFFPDTKMMKSGYITNTTSIYNFAIQGMATGEIIPIALIHFWHRAKGKNIKVFATIHDSIAVRVHKDSVKEAEEIAKQSLTLDVYRFLERVYKYTMTVPLGLGAKVSRNWADTKEETKYDIFPDGTIIDRT